VAPTVWRAGTAAQNWGEAPAPQAQCATPLGLSLSEGLGISADEDVAAFDEPAKFLLQCGNEWKKVWQFV
jgi:hypothetical protein